MVSQLEEALRLSKDSIICAIHEDVEIYDLHRHTCLCPDWSMCGIGYFLLQQHYSCPSGIPDCCPGFLIPTLLHTLLAYSESVYAQEGVLLYQDCIIVPSSLSSCVMQNLHTAHQGTSMIEQCTHTIVYWPSMSTDIPNTRDGCAKCDRNAPHTGSHSSSPHHATLYPKACLQISSPMAAAIT